MVARVVANGLTKTLGQGVIVDNRPGAGNTIGSKEAALADPDGYTLHYSSSSGLVIAPLLQKNAGYDPITSFEPIALVAQSTEMLVINPAVPAKTVQELVAYAKANPGKVNFSSGGVGVLPHLIGEWFKSAAKIDVVHVPVSGWRPVDQRAGRGRCAIHLRRRERAGAADPGRQAARARDPEQDAHPEMPELPDHDRERLPGLRGDELDRAARARQDPEADHRQAQCRGERSRQDAGIQGCARQARAPRSSAARRRNWPT